MTALRLGDRHNEEHDDDPEANREPLTKKAWIPSLGVLGAGGSIGAGITMCVIELLKSDPHDAIKLLYDWGPRFLLGFCGMIFVWDLIRRVLRMLSRGVDFVGELSTGVNGMSSALKDIAAKGDRDQEENRTAITWNSRQINDMKGTVDKIYTILSTQKGAQ